MEAPPYYRRLVEHLESLEEPLIQIWGWPGMGKRRFLKGLAEDATLEAEVLTPREIEDPRRWHGTVAQGTGRGVRWFLCDGGEPAAWNTLSAALKPHQSLIVTTPIRHPLSGGRSAVVAPQQLLLETEELQTLWLEVAGSRLNQGQLRTLYQATQGWYRPLRVVAQATARSEVRLADAGQLDSLAPVDSFLRNRVLGSLGPLEQDILLELSLAPTQCLEAFREAWVGRPERCRGLRFLIEQAGLVLSDEGCVRLPALLLGFLERERRSRWSADETRSVRRRLGLAYYLIERPDTALDHFVEAGDRTRTRRLLDLEWLQLLASACTKTLNTGLSATQHPAKAAQDESGPRRLLAVLLACLESPRWPRGSWGKPAASLRTLAAELRAAGEDPPAALGPVSEILAAFLELLDPRAGNPRWPEWTEWQRHSSSLPAPMRALGYLGEAAFLYQDEGSEDAGPALSRALDLIAAKPREPPRVEAPQSPVDQLFQAALKQICRTRPEAAGVVERHRSAPPFVKLALAPNRHPSFPPLRSQAGVGRYRLVLFGHPALHYRGEDGSDRKLRWPLRRAFKILAYIASTPGLRVHRHELVEAVWPHADEETIRKNFHPTVSVLRRTLEQGSPGGQPPLRFKNGLYQLDPELWHIDVVEFQHKVHLGRENLETQDTEAALADWQGAWRLYRGGFLRSHDEPWIVGRRTELQRHFLTVLRDLGELYFRLHRIEDAEDAFRSLLVEDPLQEAIHVSIMRIYAQRGRRDLVRRQYERLGNLLQEELGVEPMPDTSAEYHRLMS